MFHFFMGIVAPFFCDYVRHELEVWSRPDSETEWTRHLHTAGDTAALSLGVALAVDDLYREPLPPR